MNRQTALLCLLFALTAGVIPLLLTGCDTSPANEDVTISPASASVAPGGSCTFTASGGYDYKWSLKTAGVGTLSSLTGNSTVYTAPSSVATGATQTVMVDSTIEGTSGSTSNSAAYHASAEATVTIQ